MQTDKLNKYSLPYPPLGNRDKIIKHEIRIRVSFARNSGRTPKRN